MKCRRCWRTWTSPARRRRRSWSRHDLRDVRLYASSVVEWLNCLLDVCEARIVLDAKRDQRFQM